MKVVHSQRHLSTFEDLLKKARELENSGETEEAAELYNQLIKKDPLNELPYHRLMVIYRKKKEFRKELAVIKSGLKTFLEFYKSRKPKNAAGNTKVSKLSRSILKSTGLLTTEGKQVYQEGPVAKWEKRKKVVESKI
jgi:DNA-binding SARP family transcriptional activator